MSLRLAPRTLALLTALGAAAALAVAYASQTWDQLVPCPLCLVERWPYRIVIALGLLAAISPRALVRPLLMLAGLCLLGGAVVGFVHVGVEFRWWPSPLPECAAPQITGATLAERLAQMPARPSMSCEDATYLIPGFPVSMAAMDMLYALAMSIFVAVSLAIPRRTS